MKLFSMLFSRTQTKAQAQKTGASEAYLRRIATLPSPEALKEVAADRFGLTTEEAEERLDEFGPNVIRTGKTHGPLYRFMGSLINPFNIVLFLVAAITFVTDVVLSRRPDYLTAGVILFASVSTSFNIHRMRQVGDSSAWVKDSYLAPMLKAELPDDPGARFMLPSVNQGLIADVPALPSFNSSVSGGVFELYSNMGVYRGHGNVPLLDHEDLRHLLSIKYIVNPTDDESLELLSQYTVGGNTYSVYENPQALPIGFTYAYYVTQERFLQIPVEKRAWVMCKALVVHEEDVDKLVGMQPLTDSQIDAVSEQDAVAELENRRRESSSSFSRDNRTFTADIHCREETMAFFSVTYDEGWSATVNGEAVPSVKSSGLMAVPVSGGDNHIVFHYTPPGGTAGIVLTAVSVLGLGVYWTLSRYLAKRKQREKEC